ncbi:hypothetical protein KDW_61010 [Dictyobacter vulcani]|uniref:Transposase n=1 Tax=Dictyobacter vulcani TaxID=2607529 RepID=A0A5J4L0Y2_9CHLR|nr:hypothetical protein KDW_61010 [Dictyobacter vulcani]
MQLVEKHMIKQTDPRFAALDRAAFDRAAFASKNLYNAALYEIRQHFIFTGTYVNYHAIDKIMQKHEAYRALPTKVSQQVLRLLDKNWTSFFAALKAYKATLVGISVMVQEESYTSKASFLDLDTIPVYGKMGEQKPVFSGRRISRGLYKAKSGRAFNTDVNGSYNILRKALPDAFSNGIEDVNKALVALPASLVVHPVRIVIPSQPKMSRKR